MPNELSGRRFGVELEYHTDIPLWNQQLILNRLFAAHPDMHLMASGYAHSNGTCWHLKTDSSCGFELASPAMTWQDWDKMQMVLGWLNTNLSARVTRNCGLHVHHELADYTRPMLSRLYRLWCAVEPVALACVAPERRDNPFCDPLDPGSWINVVANSTGIRAVRATTRSYGRRRTLNLAPYWSIGTAEFRLHQGTLVDSEISWWTLFTQCIVELAKRRLRVETLLRMYVADNAVKLEMLLELLDRYVGGSQIVDMLLGTIPGKIRMMGGEVRRVRHTPYAVIEMLPTSSFLGAL